jgi:hypothetical protein
MNQNGTLMFHNNGGYAGPVAEKPAEGQYAEPDLIDD